MGYYAFPRDLNILNQRKKKNSYGALEITSSMKRKSLSMTLMDVYTMVPWRTQMTGITTKKKTTGTSTGTTGIETGHSHLRKSP